MIGNDNVPIAPTRNRNRNNISIRKQKWTQDEDTQLTLLMQSCPKVNWNDFTSFFQGKSSQQILERWTKVLDPTLMKGSWTRGEDETIIDFVSTCGTKSWTKLAERLPGRIGKQCRERWFNHLDPNIYRGPWTPEEDNLLISLHEKYGNHWVKISQLIPHRSDNQVKNRWNSTLFKKVSQSSPDSTDSIPKPLLSEDSSGSATSPSLGLLSPLVTGNSNFSFVSPLSSKNLWTPDFQSPSRKNHLSLSENRAELLSMIMRQ